MNAVGHIKAVPRSYRGVRFRSTLEADWASNLDKLGIAWEYEPEAIQLPGGDLYRPDFYLPDCTTWLEVKGPHDERLDKTMQLGDAGRHYPDCAGTHRGDDVMLLLWPEDDQAGLAAAIQAAPDGDTAVTIKETRWVDPDDMTAGARTLRVHRMRRRITIDNATSNAIKAIRRRWNGIDCCRGDTPWRLVVIGRPARGGSLTWGSAQGLDITVIRCRDCAKASFFDNLMSWECRVCGSDGKVYQGGAWSSPTGDGYLGAELPFTRAPRAA